MTMGEDCLVLNVWTPNATGERPVKTMMKIPTAKGLFHKGIIQSGPSRTATPVWPTHTAEIRFVFRNASDRPGAMPGAAKVEDAMSDAWIAFARHGNPSHAGIPAWPKYDVQSRPTMVFDVESRVVNDLRPIERQVHERVGFAGR